MNVKTKSKKMMATYEADGNKKKYQKRDLTKKRRNYKKMSGYSAKQ
jgi:hypothetical protein